MHKLISRVALVAVAGIVVAPGIGGCAVGGGSGKPHGSASSPATRRPAASPSASPSPSVVSQAVIQANERSYANWIAGMTSSAADIASAVSGPVMRAYDGFEAEQTQANNAAGQPVSPGTVNYIGHGGYQACFDSNCLTMSDWRTDAAGRITDLSVNGQPVSDRVAVGRSTIGSRLALSHVVAIRAADASNLVLIAFKVKGLRRLEGGDFLAQFDTADGQFQQDYSQSELPSTLNPGESSYAVAVFDTAKVAGTLILRLNDGPEVYVSTRLTQVH